MKGGARPGAGRKPGSKTGSKPESRLNLKYCRLNDAELAMAVAAAKAEGKAIARFIADATVEKAKAVLNKEI